MAATLKLLADFLESETKALASETTDGKKQHELFCGEQLHFVKQQEPLRGNYKHSQVRKKREASYYNTNNKCSYDKLHPYSIVTSLSFKP